MTAPPERMCAGCRKRAEKTAFLRVARDREGRVSVDSAGTSPGRGAYVHRTTQCIEAATRSGAIARALRTGIGPDELGRLGNAMSQGAL